MPVHSRRAYPRTPASFREAAATATAASASDVGAPAQRLSHGVRPCIAEYRALKQLPRYQDALALLRRVGSIVQPIMTLRGWHLPLLVEIYPKKDDLLGFNVNAGRKIALRLRRPHDTGDFYDEESIVETMLHELAHNLRGPHDDVFYQHLDKLTQEWQETRAGRWLPGQGFLMPGRRLNSGGGNLRTSTGAVLTPLAGQSYQSRTEAAGAAQGRRKQKALGDSHLLGGHPENRPFSLVGELSPREAAAVAAERRLAIQHGCPSSNILNTQEAARQQEDDEISQGIAVIVIDDDEDDNVGGFASEGKGDGDADADADAEEVQFVDELPRSRDVARKGQTMPLSSTGDDSDDDDVVIVGVTAKPSERTRSATRAPPLPTNQLRRASVEAPRAVQQTRAAAALRSGLLAADTSGPHDGRLRGALSPPPVARDVSQRSAHGWACQVCTLANTADVLTCAACRAVRPGVPAWTCARCGHAMVGDMADFWCCAKCGQVKVA